MSEEENLPIGQREVNEGSEFTAEEINMIEEHGLTIGKVREHLTQTGPKSLETAIGSLMDSHGAEGGEKEA